MKNTLIAIVGNTGVGKSQLAVELARKLNGEIINGDSMQMYRGLDIITNKHPAKEQMGIPHHLLGHIEWDKQYSVTQFEQEVTGLANEIEGRGRLPIVVGGTHYYIQALIAENSTIGQRDDPAVPLTEEQLEILEDPSRVEQQLKQFDPVICAKFHPNDTRRLRRALEIFYTTGKKPSDIYQQQAESTMKLRYKVLVFWIHCQRDVLNARLDARVDTMLDSGLMNEIDEMYEQWKLAPDLSDGQGVWQVLGFKQFLPYLQGEDPTLDVGLASMKAETRQYAKKQTKWIVNKLIPMVRTLGGTMAALDSTDLDNWQHNVADRAVDIAKDWLASEPFRHELIPAHINSERKQQDFDRGQWVRYECEHCTDRRGQRVVVMGDAAWKTHLHSRSHKRQVEYLRKKQRFVNQTVQGPEDPKRRALNVDYAAAAAAGSAGTAVPETGSMSETETGSKQA